MAKGEIQIRGDLNAAVQSFVNAVTYIGGSVTSMNPARPIEFSVRRTGSMMGGFGAPYGGTATFIPTGNGQTRALIELKPKLWYTAVLVVICVVLLGIIGGVALEAELAVTAGVAVAAATGVTLYLYHVPWPQKVIERITGGVHGAVGAFDAPAPAASAGPVPQPAGVAPATPQPAPSQPSGPVADQLRQLGELHQQGLINDAEFEAKKAELLKRL